MTQSFHSDARTDSQRMRDEAREPDDMFDEDPSVARERVEERGRAEARNAARDRAEQISHGGDLASNDGSFGTSYLGDRSSEESWQEWRKIQADFVDSPRDAVAHAHGLVGDLIDNIVRQFNQERQEMEQRWSSGQDVSTEELRKCLQTYRDFFGRLLSKVDVKN